MLTRMMKCRSDGMSKKTKYGLRGNYNGNASAHPLYFRWMNMLRRCYEPKFYGYKSYGGKGVTVEPFLQTFTNYVNFVSSLPNYEKLIENPNDWQIDKDVCGGNVYSRKTLKIIPSKQNLETENYARRMPVYRVLSDGSKDLYESITSASNATGIHRGNIARAARVGYKAGGYEWRYADA